ncbi:unnamed protein product [Ectocarpus sp. 8 AP-2014]
MGRGSYKSRPRVLPVCQRLAQPGPKRTQNTLRVPACTSRLIPLTLSPCVHSTQPRCTPAPMSTFLPLREPTVPGTQAQHDDTRRALPASRRYGNHHTKTTQGEGRTTSHPPTKLKKKKK